MSLAAYIQPTKVDSPAVGCLYSARAGKRLAWGVVRSLRQRIKAEPIGGNRSVLRLQLLKAESAHNEWARMERAALEAIEQRANELGKTTVRTTLI